MLVEPASAAQVLEQDPSTYAIYNNQGMYLSGAWLARERVLRLDTIRAAVCAYYGVSVNEVMSERRTARIIRPRHVLFYLATVLTVCSLPKIGRFLGGRDHTTVLHGMNKIACLKHTDAQLAADIAAIRKTLGGT